MQRDFDDLILTSHIIQILAAKNATISHEKENYFN